MTPLLDEFYTTFLHALVYTEGRLSITVAEGFRASAPTDVMIGDNVISGSYALGTSPVSRLVEVTFEKPIAWQLVDESWTSRDPYEVCETGGAMAVFSKSRYLDFVEAHHGWFEEIRGSGKHYRVWTENEVIDVVACEAPTITRAGA